jgi:hypothetical protein
MRKITVFSSKLNKKKIVNSSATTWGSFRSEISDLITESMSATVLPTKNQLVDDGAVLPVGDFVLILKPVSVKSGSIVVVDTAAVLAELADKFKEVIDELTDEIEAGAFNKDVEDDGLSSDAELAKIASSLQ